ncbi:MAG TPA: hypothetical protein VLC46_04715 [Thermoanaerobaculia bacterium]|nr:hypothetical protein [Thermoanaerobaculia bacterium]
MTRCLLLLLIFGLNIIGLVRWYGNRRPGVPLDLAIEAIRNRDSTAFTEAVDVDRLVASYYDQHLLQGRPVPEATRSLYIKAIGRRLRHWIDAGVTETSYPRFDALVMFLRESADLRRWRIHDVNETAGSGTITLYNAANDTVEMKLKIVREAGRWRVAELLNVADVVDEVRDSEWRRLDPMLQTINDAVVIVPPSPSDSVNNANNPITTYSGRVRVKKGRVESAVCDLYSAGGSFVRTIAVVTSPLDAGQEATFSFPWRDCGAVTDCLPTVRWAQVRVNGMMIVVRPRALD